MDLKLLALNFPPEDIEWRAGAGSPTNQTALALAYLTTRAIMNRLDEVCGPENWRNEYARWGTKGVICGISIKCGDEWVTKYDGADETDIEPTKGGFSDSMKRAAVQWGMGRYLYKLEAVWVQAQFREVGGKQKVVKLIEKPTLPQWALPEGYEAPKTDFKPSTPKATTKAPIKPISTDVKTKLKNLILDNIDRTDKTNDQIAIEAADVLEVLTTWTDKEGEHHDGRRSMDVVSEKMAAVAYGKLKKQLENKDVIELDEEMPV
jgi:hypothetical protein